MKLRINMDGISLPQTLILLLPVFPLLDFFLFKGFPYITAFAYLMIIIIYGNFRRISDNTIALFTGITVLSLLLNGIVKGFTVDQFKYLLCYTAFASLGLHIGKDIDKYIKTLIKFTYCYFSVNTLVFIYRLVVFNYDFNRVRMGTAIFGGNSAHFIFMMMLLLLKDYDEYRKHYYVVLIITALNSVFYTSKGAIIATVVWVVLDILYQRKTKAINWKVIMAVIAGALIFRFYIFDKIGNFLNFALERFLIWEDLFKSTGGIMGTRAKIIDFCVGYIKSHPSILICGNGPTFFRDINPWLYSNTHNLFMDVVFDIGVLGVLIFFVICFKSLLYSKNRIYYLVCIGYATIEGVALFFIDGTSPIMTGFAFFFIIAYYYSRVRIKDMHNR